MPGRAGSALRALAREAELPVPGLTDRDRQFAHLRWGQDMTATARAARFGVRKLAFALHRWSCDEAPDRVTMRCLLPALRTQDRVSPWVSQQCRELRVVLQGSVRASGQPRRAQDGAAPRSLPVLDPRQHREPSEHLPRRRSARGRRSGSGEPRGAAVRGARTHRGVSRFRAQRAARGRPRWRHQFGDTGGCRTRRHGPACATRRSVEEGGSARVRSRSPPSNGSR